ncbi:MAG: LemA family protein [Lachnospiraceae bacterium]|nr:LemA family protein [Lachnospiraceae bacterium]
MEPMIILIIVMVILIFWAISTGNRIKMMKVKIDEAKSGIDIALIKRYDILTESLNVAKGYAAHEKGLMLQLVQARSGMSMQQSRAVMENQEKVLENLKVVAESYPQLYSNELFKELQSQIAVTNEHLSAAKRVLNSNIALYNQKIVAFPASIIAVITGCRKIDFFKETDEKKKRDVHMKF